MTDTLRDRLAESITDAIETILDQHEFMHNTSRCSCGLRNNMDGDILDLHRISLIGETVRNTLTTPGIAVVELPEPSEFADMWLHGDVHAASPSTHPGTPVALEIDPGSPVCFSIEYARDLAAALLAAADYAERDQ